MKLYTIFISTLLCLCSINARSLMTRDEYYGYGQGENIYNPAPYGNGSSNRPNYIISKGETITSDNLADSSNPGMGMPTSPDNNFNGYSYGGTSNDNNGQNTTTKTIPIFSTKTIPSEYLTQATTSTTVNANISTTTFSTVKPTIDAKTLTGGKNATNGTNSNPKLLDNKKEVKKNDSIFDGSSVIFGIVGASFMILIVIVVVLKKRVTKPSEQFQRKLEF